MSSSLHSNAEGSAERTIEITRIFDAPRRLVWSAWTDPSHFMKWWGPRGFTSSSCAIDLRIGGRYLYNMRSADGREYWNTGSFTEIVPMEKLAFTHSMSDEKGNTGFRGAGANQETFITLTFSDFQGRTKMTMVHSGFHAGDMLEGASMGWNQAFDKMAENVLHITNTGAL